MEVRSDLVVNSTSTLLNTKMIIIVHFENNIPRYRCVCVCVCLLTGS